MTKEYKMKTHCEKVVHLLKNSGLPGPRSNLELLYSFAKSAGESEINECMTFLNGHLHNSPEEFVACCGVVGYCIYNRDNVGGVMNEIRKYASHASWRIREAVAMGIQEIAEGNMDVIINNFEIWLKGNELEKRAVVAALCEPKLLKGKSVILRVLAILTGITLEFEQVDGKLTDQQDSLRKALGYGWSVAVVSLPEEGKAAFEAIAESKNKHIQWIIRENLKKKRLSIMNHNWVEEMKNR